MDDFVAIARLVRSRGIKGELVAEILTDFPERFESLKTVIAVDAQGERGELKIEKAWFQSGRVVLKFEGYDSIESAETLRNLELCVPESDAMQLGDGEFFEWSLQGCRVENVDGTAIGTVSGLMRTGGTELLVVKGETKEYLIPFAESICTEVDIDNRLIKVDPPDGLLDF
ncbi:MAG: ribosome maturation factor RimM [Pyrinomonadaceae bacterium]